MDLHLSVYPFSAFCTTILEIKPPILPYLMLGATCKMASYFRPVTSSLNSLPALLPLSRPAPSNISPICSSLSSPTVCLTLLFPMSAAPNYNCSNQSAQLSFSWLNCLLTTSSVPTAFSSHLLTLLASSSFFHLSSVFVCV